MCNNLTVGYLEVFSATMTTLSTPPVSKCSNKILHDNVYLISWEMYEISDSVTKVDKLLRRGKLNAEMITFIMSVSGTKSRVSLRSRKNTKRIPKDYKNWGERQVVMLL